MTAVPWEWTNWEKLLVVARDAVSLLERDFSQVVQRYTQKWRVCVIRKSSKDKGKWRKIDMDREAQDSSCDDSEEELAPMTSGDKADEGPAMTYSSSSGSSSDSGSSRSSDFSSGSASEYMRMINNISFALTSMRYIRTRLFLSLLGHYCIHRARAMVVHCSKNFRKCS